MTEARIPSTATTQPGPTRYRAGSLEQGMLITEALRGSNLPEQAQNELRQRLAGQDLTSDEITSAVRQTATVYESILAATGSPLPGQGGADGDLRVGTEDYDRKVLALEALIRGTTIKDPAGNPVQPYRSLRQAYHDLTGRHEHNLPGSASVAEWMLAESVGGMPEPVREARVRESVLSTTWASALGETLHRILIAEYNADPLDSWRQLVSQNTPVNDFKTQRRERIGGFDTLTVVGENVGYPALTTPADEEATFSVSKYGGTEIVTLEAMANDDIQAIRRIPFNMARAANLTIYSAVWVTTIAGNAAVTYDAFNLFDNANHGNDNATTPLGEAGLETLRRRMVQQQRPGETSGFIGIQPMAIVTPSELWLTGQKLTRSAFAQASGESDGGAVNAFQGLGHIEVPLFSDANDWYLIANPRSVPMLEMGWFQNRQDPEILIQDQPTVGAVFTNDRITYKVRHIWSLVVLDHRGFQRATNV